MESECQPAANTINKLTKCADSQFFESAFSARTEELQVCLETERDTRNNWKWPWHNPDETTGIFNRFFLCVSCIKYYELVKQNLNCSRKMKMGKKEA